MGKREHRQTRPEVNTADTDGCDPQPKGEPKGDPVTEIECPCCGDVGAVSNARGLYYDGQGLVCGCPGQVSFDEDTEPWISICDVTPCHCYDTPATEA